jgi:formylglycine-generating enzyme required for sulfatase activity
MGDREITQEEYQNKIEDNPSSSKDKNKPVENVSWYNAIEYCNKRSLAESLSPYYYVNISDGDIFIDDSDWNHVPGKSYLSFMSNDEQATGYRLPRDAEWEYAAMGGVFRSSENPLGEEEK